MALIVRSDHVGEDDSSVVSHLDPRVKVIEVARHFWTQRQVGKVVREWCPEIIHCHLRRATRMVAKLGTSLPTVSTLHIGINGPHFAQMSGLVCNADWQLQSVPTSYRGQVLRAYNSLVPHRRLSPEEIDSRRAELGAGPGTFVIGGVGRMTKVKGWDLLIKAVHDHPEWNKVKLVLLGTGSALAQFRAQAAGDGRIVFMGYRDDVKDFYQAFDLFVCPSRFEPMPRAMLEAMDAGTPVVASATGGCKELVDEFGGDLFGPDDVKELASILGRHVRSPQPRHRPDLRAHHVEASGAQLVQFYLSLLRPDQAIENRLAA